MIPKFLHTDTHPVEQPENSYRFALNAIISDGKFVNESGNVECASLPEGYNVIGHVNTADSVILFLVSVGSSQIGRLKNCVYETMIDEPGLNFSLQHQMLDVRFRIRRGCEEVVYFTDNYNPPRSINLSKLDTYYTNGVFEPLKLNLVQDVTIPTMDASIVEYGGTVRMGTYNFAIRYLDEDLNPTHWIYTTPTIAVYDESIFAPYKGIDGGIGVEVDALSGIPNTSKAIRLNIGNIDSKFAYYQIMVIAANSASGRPSSFVISPETPITQTSFVFNGGIENYTNGTAEELAIRRPDIEKVRTLETANNRLLLANLKGKTVNFADLQRAASKITTVYRIEEVDPFDPLAVGNSKNPNTYYEKMSEMGDEVRAYGIVFVFEDGYESPACHIPGRVADVFSSTGGPINGPNVGIPSPEDLSKWDTSPISVWTEDLKHIVNDPLTYDGSLKRYQIYNTATAATPISGLMGYHQLENSTYPDIKDCNGQSIWGVDASGQALAGRNIRHHKMPDRRLQRQYSYTTNKLRLIGVQFANIEYPDSRIIGHYIVAAERSEENKTVLDKGVAFRYKNCDDRRLFSYMGATVASEPYQFVATPRFLYNNELLNGYIKVENDLSITRTHTATDIKELTGVGPDAIYFGYRNIQASGISIALNQTNYAVERTMRLSAMSKDTLDGVEIGNLSMANNVNLYKTFEFLPQHAYTSIKLNRDVYTNIFNLRYYKIHPNMFTNTVPSTVFGGDTFISELKLTDYKIREIDDGLWNQVAIIGSIIGAVVITAATAGIAAPAGIAIAVAVTAGIAGLIGITATGAAAYIKDVKDGLYENCLKDTQLDQAVQSTFGLFDPLDKKTIIVAEHFENAWVESEINLGLRHAANDECGSYYTGQEDFFNYLQTKVTYFDTEEAEFFVKPIFCPQIYLYNKDYSRKDKQRSYNSLPVAFDFCSECLEKFPNRIVWSEISLDEQNSDAFKVFLPNNAQDVSAQFGEITNLIRKAEKLYLTTTDMLYYIPENLQERVNSELVTYIGTGEYLSIPPREVVDSQLGSIGCVDSTSVINTPYGTVILDSKEGFVFLLGSSLEPISLAGMDRFFRENLQLQSTQPLNPAHPHGVGYVTVYDAEEKRIIITKKDFVPIGRITDSLLPGEVGLFYSTQDGYWYSSNAGTLSLVDVNNANLFRNYGWTISYSVLEKKWISFHSYVPGYAFYDKRTFYTLKDSKVWSHNSEWTFHSFYENDYPHILSVVDRLQETALWQYLSLHTEATTQEIERRYITFDQAWFFTNRQSSGLQILRPISSQGDHIQDATTDEFGVIKIDKRERVWNIPSLFDYVVNYGVPVESKEWIDISSFYPIDKVPNPLSTSASKDWLDLEDFRDKYIQARFIFNLNTVRLLTNFVEFNKIPSVR